MVTAQTLKDIVRAMAIPRLAVDDASRSLNELAELARSGQPAAFEHIMRRCNQRLFRVAHAVLNDEDEAEDALQEAYIHAYNHLDSFRGDAKLTTWLTRIVLNESYQRLRRQKPTVDIDQIEIAQRESRVLPFPTRPGFEDPAAQMMRSQMRDLIEQAVASLPEPFRVVFVMRDIEEYSIEDTATALGIEPATVKTRLFRARRRLREALHTQLSSSLTEAFPFLGVRCARLTDAVMRRIATPTL